MSYLCYTVRHSWHPHRGPQGRPPSKRMGLARIEDPFAPAPKIHDKIKRTETRRVRRFWGGRVECYRKFGPLNRGSLGPGGVQSALRAYRRTAIRDAIDRPIRHFRDAYREVEMGRAWCDHKYTMRNTFQKFLHDIWGLMAIAPWDVTLADVHAGKLYIPPYRGVPRLGKADPTDMLTDDMMLSALKGKEEDVDKTPKCYCGKPGRVIQEGNGSRVVRCPTHETNTTRREIKE